MGWLKGLDLLMWGWMRVMGERIGRVLGYMKDEG